MLKLEQLEFSYNKDKKTLTDINLEIEPGTVVALAGRNGSGKTTLTRVIMGLLKGSGKIILNGTEMQDAKAADMARYIGYVFQNPDQQLFAASVEEEAAYAPKQLGMSESEAAECVKQALEMTGLSGMEKQLPQLLSKGLKQRLSIASALAAKPQILILDEPTTGQDCRERTVLLRLVRSLKKSGMTIIMVTHDMDIIAEHANKVIVLEQGNLKFAGTPEALFSDEAKVVSLGLELPEAVQISKELGLPLCLTPQAVYSQLEKRKGSAAI